MMRLLASACAFALAAASAQAALLPERQRAAEFEAILKSAEVSRAFAGRGLIDRIARVGDDLYEVAAGPCALAVAIATDEAAGAVPGPRRIALKLGAASCR